MTNLPSIKQLQYLLAVHQHQHFGRAASACFIGQSTLSSAIQTLEETLGCQLIERENRSLMFTSIGEEVVERSRKIINDTISLKELTKSFLTPLSGKLVVGVIPTIASFIAAPLYHFCKQTFCDLELVLRRICNECKTPYHPDKQEQSWLTYLGEDISSTQFWRGQGCTACSHSGYKGRVGIFELLEMNDAMMDALRINDTQRFAEAAKNSANFAPLSYMALTYAKQGITSLDEVFKVAEYVPEVVGDDDAAL